MSKIDRAQPVVRRRRKAAEKPPMPAMLEPIAAEAAERHRRRHANPGVVAVVEKVDAIGYVVASPHRDEEAWGAMICDALGTRSESTAQTFLIQLTELCGQTFHPDDAGGGEWCPDERELNMILNMVAGIRPRNEMEAALAAQMVAVHLMTMKASAQSMQGYGVDPLTAAIAGKLARTFVMQSEALAKMRGGKTTRQKITVKHEKHIHEHKHVHLDGGVPESRGQPHARDGDAPVSALPSPDTLGRVVPLRCDQGEEGLSDARRGMRNRRT